MAIQILPARLANQIAAGEVVERPASVVKELVENSLDAGASKITITIEKGGAKRIRITDDGCGIDHQDLTLALSRHATSKIKDLDDLEGIASLGFRGEALASISSVARLTLTSRTERQTEAWQAHAEGRDMAVVIQPAAHPVGTTIDVVDLFFNTPARRKFLRTEKTEFTHIDELVKRIALSRFDVALTLIHNGKTVRQFRPASTPEQCAKRVAAVCGQRFIDHSVSIDCQHDNMHLWGWVATPEFHRQQNDLCYSYVNGRMMRDKLINHAIRQAFAERLSSEVYPAFVLFLELDFREVDVNVHPAKHEVRFHQGRYVHDFIYSVINKALTEQLSVDEADYYQQYPEVTPAPEYIAPLRPETNGLSRQYDTSSYLAQRKPSKISDASRAYSALLTTAEPKASLENHQSPKANDNLAVGDNQLLYIHQERFALFVHLRQLRLLPLAKMAQVVAEQEIHTRFAQGVVTQPLLVPVVISVSKEQRHWLEQQQPYLEKIGLSLQFQGQDKLQLRQFPAMLRHLDVNRVIEALLSQMELARPLNTDDWLSFITTLMVAECYQNEQAMLLWQRAQQHFGNKFSEFLLLNSVTVDLTSELTQLT